MPYDLLIKNGTIVDGTGAAAYHGNIAAAGGCIVEVGDADGPAARVIDASDLVVSPGFIDPHTHYDAQICWDPLVTCSSWHGVTTVIMGNCGVGLAPCKPAEHEVAAMNLVHVEAIPYDVLEGGLTWDWQTFPEYIDAAQRRGVGINVGFLAALSPFRHWVMGEDAMNRAATPDETAKIKGLLSEAMSAGALGWSMTVMQQHLGYKGLPLACRLASDDELRAYAGALKELDRGVIEIALTRRPNGLSEREYQLLELLIGESGRPVTWLNLRDSDEHPEACMKTLQTAAPLLQTGARPQVAVRPLIIDFHLRNPFIFGMLDACKPLFATESTQEKARIYANPAFRAAFRAQFRGGRDQQKFWESVELKEVGNPKLQPLLWSSVAQIARTRGQDPMDVFFDLPLEDDLKSIYMVPLLDIDPERVGRKLSDPRTMIGLSDGGAHVDMLCNAGYPTYLLGTFVRERQALSLEYAIKRITSEPAAFFGLRGRGRLAPGMAADITIFDRDTVGCAVRPEVRHDLPRGGRRMVSPAEGIKSVIVNGQVLLDEGRHSGVLPGQALRSGQTP
ncbi:MAG TPA: amidohydrolase family protein [Candidatus Binataceae bacterium]|nr:amidohydrolase family protein [Candidatus Binataceae bacterium]